MINQSGVAETIPLFTLYKVIKNGIEVSSDTAQKGSL